MSKKLIKSIIALCLASVLFCGLCATAFADKADVIEGYMVPYTVASGDTLYSICAAKGVNYSDNQALICAFSGVKDSRYIYAGKVLWLPVLDKGSAESYYTLYSHTVVSGDTWYSLCKGYGVNYNSALTQIKALNSNSDKLLTGLNVIIPVISGSTASGSASSAGSSAASSGKAAGTEEKAAKSDTSYRYLVPVVLASGDTVSKLCKANNCDFSVYSSTIMKINSIKSFNTLPVGKTLFLPTNAAPAEGEYYTVSEHTVVKGDTILSICKEYGVSYSATSALIKAINPGVKNLSYIYVGQKLLIPAAKGTAAAANAEKASNAPDDSNNVSSIMILSSEDGEIISLVNGEHRTSASEGTAVTIKITPAEGKKAVKVIVTTYEGNKPITVKKGVFTMPDEAVVVKVEFADK